MKNACKEASVSLEWPHFSLVVSLIIPTIKRMMEFNRVATGQGKVREIQGQGKVREFCNWSGKFGILRKVREFWNWSGKFDFLMSYAQ